MFKVRPKNNPNVTYTVYAVVPYGTHVHFLIFVNFDFVLSPATDFIPVDNVE